MEAELERAAASHKTQLAHAETEWQQIVSVCVHAVTTTLSELEIALRASDRRERNCRVERDAKAKALELSQRELIVLRAEVDALRDRVARTAKPSAPAAASQPRLRTVPAKRASPRQMLPSTPPPMQRASELKTTPPEPESCNSFAEPPSRFSEFIEAKRTCSAMHSSAAVAQSALLPRLATSGLGGLAVGKHGVRNKLTSGGMHNTAAITAATCERRATQSHIEQQGNRIQWSKRLQSLEAAQTSQRAASFVAGNTGKDKSAPLTKHTQSNLPMRQSID